MLVRFQVGQRRLMYRSSVVTYEALARFGWAFFRHFFQNRPVMFDPLLDHPVQLARFQKVGKKHHEQKVRPHFVFCRRLVDRVEQGLSTFRRDPIDLLIGPAVLRHLLADDQPILGQFFQGRVDRTVAGILKMTERTLFELFTDLISGTVRSA